jgi:PAS domain S-box-containing protein
MTKKTKAPTNPNPLSILLVEDEPAHVEAIRRAFQSADLNVNICVASTLKDYRNAIAASLPDIALMDMKLPDGRAVDVITYPPESCSFPIVVMTSYGNEEIAVGAIKAGALDYVVKSPEAFSNMPRTIERALKEWKLIQERKQAEEAMREGETRYRSVLQSATDAIVTVDSSGMIIGWNSAAEHIFGYSYTEAIGQSFTSIVSLYSFDKHTNGMKGLQSEGGQNIIGKTIEFQGFRKDKSVFPIELSLSSWETKSGQFFTGIIRDITERKQAEEELKRSEEKYRSIFENVQDVYYETLFDGTILEISPSIEFISKGQYRRSDLIGKSMYEFYVDSKSRDTIIAAIQKTDSVTDFEVQLKNRDGSSVPCSISAKMSFTAEGRPEKIIGSMHDISERKQAEDDLQFRNVVLSTQQEASIDGILVVDEDANIISYNHRFVEMWGVPQGMVEKKSDEPVLKFVMNQAMDPRSFLQQVQYLYGHKLETSRDEIILKNGQVFDRYSAPMVGQNDRYYGRVWYFRDITERKRAEEALRETRDYLENLLSFANAPIIVWDNNNRITRFNLAFERLTGYTMYDVVGKRPEMLFSAEMQADFSALLSRTSDGENLISVEMPIHCKDGSNRIVLWNTANIYAADVKTIIATIAHGQDITDRKQAEEALQESELRFRSLYENTTIGLYRTTPDGDILLANPTLVKMLGYTSFQELTERNLEKDGFESSSQRKEFLEKIERDGEVKNLDAKWIRQDGMAIFVLESARAIRDSHGKTLYYDGTVEDITERKQMEEGLRQMQKLEGLGTLAGGIAHDFNNILGIILAYITSTKRFKDDPTKLDLAVDTIVKAVERGKTLVQQILTFARKTETEFGAVNVNDVVMEIMTMIFETFPKILTYTQNFDKSITFINADRSQLHQVLLNLCVNARDAMPKGGVLTINTRMVSSISLRNQHPEAVASSYVCIEVSDTGEGMSEKIRNRIFEPFFTTKELGKGTGLGLAVVFGVVQSHKGFIDVESELGKGTTFRLYLPTSQVAEPISEKEEETLEEIPGGTETLLVAEDEEMLMMSLQMVLVEKGYKVLSAGDGLTALKIYQEKKNDVALVLTDLGLPKMNGKDVCAQIKKLNPNARMIIATGYLDPEMKSEFLKAGVQNFLFKPYDLRKVLKLVRQVLDEK